MKNTIKIATALSAVLVNSTALGVAGLDRLVFTPGFLFEKGNYAELTLANSNPNVRPADNRSANVAAQFCEYTNGFRNFRFSFRLLHQLCPQPSCCTHSNSISITFRLYRALAHPQKRSTATGDPES